MLVTKDNFQLASKYFQESLDLCDFLSFDCEMTGIRYDIQTGRNKYDDIQYQYHKFKKTTNTYELIQIGFSFYFNELIQPNDKTTKTIWTSMKK